MFLHLDIRRNSSIGYYWIVSVMIRIVPTSSEEPLHFALEESSEGYNYFAWDPRQPETNYVFSDKTNYTSDEVDIY